MNRVLVLLLIMLFSWKIGISQLTPMDVQYKRKIPGDSMLLNFDSIIVTKYQIYIKNIGSVSCHPNRPVNFRAFIEGYELSDSVSLKTITQKIVVKLGNPAYLADSWTLGVIKPNSCQNSFFRNIRESNYFSDQGDLDKISVGDFILIACITGYDKKAIKLCDIPTKVYKVVK